MPEYEITYISRVTGSDEEHAKLDAEVDQQVTTRGGTIAQSPAGVRRKLVYPVHGETVGWLRTLAVTLEPDQVEGLREHLKRAPGTLRVTILRTPARGAVSLSIFEAAKAPVIRPTVAPVKTSRPRRAVTMAEVEEKIEKALEETVK